MVLRDMTLENPIRAIREISHDITCTPPGAPGQRPGGVARSTSRPSTSTGRCATPRPRTCRRRRSRRSRCGSTAHRHREGSADARPRVRLGDQAQADRGATATARPAADAPEGRADRPRSTTTSAATAASSTGCRRRAWSSASCTDADIDEAVETPPQTTRARLRGEFIRRAKERKRDYTVDWVHLKLNDQAQRTVLCKDPFKSPRRAGREAHRLACSRAVRSAPPRSTELLERAHGAQRVELDDRGRAYVAHPAHRARWRSATRWCVNTTAVELGLGTGGWHVVHWNLARTAATSPGPATS